MAETYFPIEALKGKENLMLISDQTMVLFLLIGVIIGAIYTLERAIIAIFSVKKLGAFLFDFTFAALTCMLTFIGALSVTGGPLRLIPLLLEVIGAVAVYYTTGAAVLSIIGRLQKIFSYVKSATFSRFRAANRENLGENK